MKVHLTDEQIDNFPDEYKSLLKNDMDMDDIKMLGDILIRYQLSNFRNKLSFWFNKLKSKFK